MSAGIVLSLCDRTGVMVQPWLEAGYECWVVDVQHRAGRHRDGRIVRVGCDVRTFNFHAMPAPLIVFAFPPCTNLSVSGARWFADKGLESLHESLGLVVACKRICEQSDVPWMLENPVGMLSRFT
jgi:site-specific DNA-cytosine methylase